MQDTQLQELKKEILNELTMLSDAIASDDEVGYDLLLGLYRDTRNRTLLQKAFQKAQQLEDPKQKAEALLSILDEVELSSESDQVRQGAADPSGDTGQQ